MSSVQPTSTSCDGFEDDGSDVTAASSGGGLNMSMSLPIAPQSERNTCERPPVRTHMKSTKCPTIPGLCVGDCTPLVEQQGHAPRQGGAARRMTSPRARDAIRASRVASPRRRSQGRC
eukprot:4264381-Prymnesium_polylepis.3